jgi:hypothetical protein
MGRGRRPCGNQGPSRVLGHTVSLFYRGDRLMVIAESSEDVKAEYLSPGFVRGIVHVRPP